MNTNLTRHVNHVVTSIRNTMASYLTDTQKQIAEIALAAIGVLVACYLSYRCYLAYRTWYPVAKQENKQNVPTPSEKSNKKEEVVRAQEEQHVKEIHSPTVVREDVKVPSQLPDSQERFKSISSVPADLQKEKADQHPRVKSDEVINRNEHASSVTSDGDQTTHFPSIESNSTIAHAEDQLVTVQPKDTSTPYPLGKIRPQKSPGYVPAFITLDSDEFLTADDRQQNLAAIFACCFHTEESREDIDALLRGIWETIAGDDKSEDAYEDAVEILFYNLTRLQDALPAEDHWKEMKIYWSAAAENELIPYLFTHRKCSLNSLIFSIAWGDESCSRLAYYGQQLHFEQIATEEGYTPLLKAIHEELGTLSEKILNLNINGLLEKPIRETIGEGLHETALDNDRIRNAILFTFKRTAVNHLKELERLDKLFDLNRASADKKHLFFLLLIALRDFGDEDLVSMEKSASVFVDWKSPELLPLHLQPLKRIPLPVAPMVGMYRRSKVDPNASPSTPTRAFFGWGNSEDYHLLSNLHLTCAKQFASCFHTTETLEEIGLVLLEIWKKMQAVPVPREQLVERLTESFEKLHDNLLHLSEDLPGGKDDKLHKIYWSKEVEEVLMPYYFWDTCASSRMLQFNFISGEKGSSAYQANDMDFRHQLQFVGFKRQIDDSEAKAVDELRDKLRADCDDDMLEEMIKKQFDNGLLERIKQHSLITSTFRFYWENQNHIHLPQLLNLETGLQTLESMNSEARLALFTRLFKLVFDADQLPDK